MYVDTQCRFTEGPKDRQWSWGGGEKKKARTSAHSHRELSTLAARKEVRLFETSAEVCFFPSVRNDDIIYCSHNDNLLIHIIKISQLIGTIFWQITVGVSDSRTVRKGDICDFCFLEEGGVVETSTAHLTTMFSCCGMRSKQLPFFLLPTRQKMTQ